MVIGVLVLLGVDVVVIVLIVATVLGRRRWVSRQAGAFRGAIRVSEGEVDGLDEKWARGYGRWVGHTFAWTKSPFLFRTVLVAGDALVDQRPAGPDEVKRLGDHPIVASLQMGRATVQVAAAQADIAGVEGPFHDEGNTVQVATA